MMNQTNNTTALEKAIGAIIENCKNVVKLSELEKLAAGTSCEGDYICCTVDITEQLQQAQQEVERLTSIIAECEEAKKKTEEAKKKEEQKEEEFLNSLNNAGKEVMSYLKGLETLAQGEKATLVHNIIKVYKTIDSKNILTVTANISAYVAMLVKEEDQDTINLLETVTCEVYNIKNNYGISAGSKVDQLNDVLLSIQDIY